MFCSNCGKEVLSESNFCSSCGQRLDRSTKGQESIGTRSSTAAPAQDASLPGKVPLPRMLLLYVVLTLGWCAWGVTYNLWTLFKNGSSNWISLVSCLLAVFSGYACVLILRRDHRGLSFSLFVLWIDLVVSVAILLVLSIAGIGASLSNRGDPSQGVALLATVAVMVTWPVVTALWLVYFKVSARLRLFYQSLLAESRSAKETGHRSMN